MEEVRRWTLNCLVIAAAFCLAIGIALIACMIACGPNIVCTVFTCMPLRAMLYAACLGARLGCFEAAALKACQCRSEASVCCGGEGFDCTDPEGSDLLPA
jgi:hypothetical protein